VWFDHEVSHAEYRLGGTAGVGLSLGRGAVRPAVGLRGHLAVESPWRTWIRLEAGVDFH
jgi:hypothetical protein